MTAQYTDVDAALWQWYSDKYTLHYEGDGSGMAQHLREEHGIEPLYSSPSDQGSWSAVANQHIRAHLHEDGHGDVAERHDAAVAERSRQTLARLEEIKKQQGALIHEEVVKEARRLLLEEPERLDDLHRSYPSVKYPQTSTGLAYTTHEMQHAFALGYAAARWEKKR